MEICTHWLMLAMEESIWITPEDPPPTRKIKKHTTSVFGQPPARHAKEAMKEAFLELQLGGPDNERHPWAARANSAPSEDYTNVFLSHAHVYALAEQFDIQPLKRLALRNLTSNSCKVYLVAGLRWGYSRVGSSRL